MKLHTSVFLKILCYVMFAGAVVSWAAPADVVKTESGQIKGVVEKGVVSFKGIPFAAAPVGDLRWRVPQPVVAWKGVRGANKFAPDCMQEPFPSDAAPLSARLDEDCLYVNVWAPASRRKNLPVIVWIYGGGFVNGGTSPAVYDGTKFAESGLIFVSFNYRVGRFGFFAHPALSAENPKGPLGNYGYMDQIAALKWVQRNIAAFGGDPAKVTIFGESAGGGSVLTLLTSPAAKGLFRGAIVQSGGGRDYLMGPRYVNKRNKQGAPSAEEIGMNFARKAGITGTDGAALKALRALPAEKVVDGLGLMSMGNSGDTHSGPMIDGEIVRESPEQAMLAGRWAKVPVMIGANNADIGFPSGRTLEELFAPFGAKAEKAKGAFNPEKSDNVFIVGWRIAADQIMIEPARFVARTVASAGVPSYEYRFSYVAESLRARMPGAFHATEIPYVFDTVKVNLGEKMTENDARAARQAHGYWVNFVKTGDPNGEGLPKWPAYHAQKDVLLEFTNEGPVSKPDPLKERLDLVAELARN